MASQREQAKIDAALDAALDALDDDSEEEDEFHDATSNGDSGGGGEQLTSTERPDKETTTTESPQSQPSVPVILGPPRPSPPPPTPPPQEDDGLQAEHVFQAMMEQMLQSELGDHNRGGDPGPGEEELLGRLMQEIQSQMQSGLARGSMEETGDGSANPTAATTAANSSAQSPKAKDKTTAPICGNEEVEKTISNLVDGMASQGIIDNDELEVDASAASETEDEMLKSLMEGIAGLGAGGGDGDDFNAEAAIDGMMENLLSKDLMYEPMKQVATKFPDWLEQKRDTLSSEEYAERRKQCDCFQNLVRVYESEPENVAKVMELMQEVQEYGQPPAEIIQDIAPGIELDDDGMPKGLPFPGNEDCSIM